MSMVRKALGGLCLLSISLLAADSPFAGAWKMNPSKSKLEGSGLDPNMSVQVERDGSGLKVSIESKAGNLTYQATLDGKAAKVAGSAIADEITTQASKEREMTARGLKGGSVVFVDLFRISHDGKSMTIIRSGSNPEGQPYKATLVFDRQ
jgi:hypothetical protein